MNVTPQGNFLWVVFFVVGGLAVLIRALAPKPEDAPGPKTKMLRETGNRFGFGSVILVAIGIAIFLFLAK